MLNRHHSLSSRMVGVILAQNGAAAALLFYSADALKPSQMLAIAFILVALTLGTLFCISRMPAPLKTDDISLPIAGKSAGLQSRDERGDDVNVMSDELERLSRSHLDRILQDESPGGERERMAEQLTRDLEAAKAEAVKARSVVDALDGGMRRLAVGDLTARLDMPFPEEFEGVRSDFNHALTTMEEALGRMGINAREVFAACADAEDGLTEAALASAGQAAAVANIASSIDALAELLRARKMQAGQTAHIAHTAALDMRRPKEMLRDTKPAMNIISDAVSRIEPAVAAIREIAFEANMLALSSGIEASRADGGEDKVKAVASRIRGLAERAADAAKDIATLSRRSAEAADKARGSFKAADDELEAMAIYMEALRDHVDVIAANSAKEIETVAGIRTNVMALGKVGRDHTARLDRLAAKMAGIGRGIGAIDHQAARFIPVTVLTPGGVSVPENAKRAKPGSHLRLVKS